MEVITLGGTSLSQSALRISDEFDIRVTEKQLEKHMATHLDPDVVARLALLMDEANDDEGSALKPRGIMTIMLNDVGDRVARREIRIESISDLAWMLRMQEEMAEADAGESVATGYESRAAERAWAQLRFIFVALGEKVPAEQLAPALKEMVRLGVEKDLVELAMPFDKVFERTAPEVNKGAGTEGAQGEDPPDEGGATAPDEIVAMLIADAQARVVMGELHARTCTDVARLLKCAQDMRKAQMARQAANRGPVKSVFDARIRLGYVMKSVKEVVSQDICHEVVLRAWSLGLDKEVSSFADVPMYQIKKVEEPDMSVATEDLRRGIKRSSEEKRAIALGELPNPYANEEDPDIPPDGIVPSQAADGAIPPPADDDAPAGSDNDEPSEVDPDIPPGE
jgi:hypothetical protein